VPAFLFKRLNYAWSGILERLDQINVLLHGVFLGHLFQLGPGIVLGAADHVGEARALALDIAVRALLVQRVELQQHIVRGPLRQFLRIGRRSFESDKLTGNLRALIDALNKSKPATSKGIYLRKVAVSSTMGVGVRVDVATLVAATV
jgi:hypothetical protein